MKKVRWTSPAALDFENQLDYIALHNETSALHIEQRILNLAQLISQFPNIGILSKRQNIREFRISDIPFVIIYEILDNTIDILHIYHTSQDH